nr:MAG TPA: hypothetical protein [Caudoviricetes sp.]
MRFHGCTGATYHFGEFNEMVTTLKCKNRPVRQYRTALHRSSLAGCSGKI